ncbi:transposase [Pseudomonas chlororaphis]|uniref:transposase n=1 Tax=Pseudomonas chlororaphis TaxID=587753 RepID=UPI003D11A94B
MKQMSFADAEYAGKRKQTRRERFLIEMDQVVPWKGLVTLIEPNYPKGDGGRPAYPLMAMLRVHLMQNWFGYPPDYRTAFAFSTFLYPHHQQHSLRSACPEGQRYGLTVFR